MNDVSSLVIIGISSMLILAMGIISFMVFYQRRVIAHQEEVRLMNEKKKLELLQASIQSEEEERNRIASELHDDVVATLSSARLFLHKNNQQQLNDEGIDLSKQLLDDSIQKIRGISHKLQPAILQHLGLEKAMQSMAETINKSNAIYINYSSTNTGATIKEDIALAIYRIAQELLTNILKHAGAENVSMNLQIQEHTTTLTIKNNGSGLTQEDFDDALYKKGSSGLKNIVNRQTAINAKLFFEKATDDTYVTILIVPY